MLFKVIFYIRELNYLSRVRKGGIFFFGLRDSFEINENLVFSTKFQTLVLQVDNDTLGRCSADKLSLGASDLPFLVYYLSYSNYIFHNSNRLQNKNLKSFRKILA